MTLKEARIKAGMSMQDLGKAAGISPAAICRYEHGKRSPKMLIAKRLALILGIEWYELMDNKKAG